MTIASELTKLNTNLTNSYTAVSNKGGTIPSSQNFDNLATSIDSIPTGSIGIPREVVNGVYQMPSQSFTFSLPSDATDLGDYAMYYDFYGGTGLTSVDLLSLTTISGRSAMGHAFEGCTSLTSVDLSNLTTISGNSGMSYSFSNCTNLISIDLSNLTTMSGRDTIAFAFYGCSALTSVDLSSLTTINGMQAMRYAFQNCTSLTTLSFPALTSITASAHPFGQMLSGVTGCTVHFPSNLQSVIGSWSDVTSGFGGTNTTVLFDLPATT